MGGDVGDVVLLHPYMLHATSQTVLGTSRIITNPPPAPRRPMEFGHFDPVTFSLIERAVLRGLGVDRLDFAATAPRQQVVPQRVIDQQARSRTEEERLASSS